MTSISRRGFLTSASFGSAAMLTGCAWPAIDRKSAESAAPARPNIIIILTDDLGYGDVSFLNPKSKIQTPCMDALAAEGVWAADAHSPSAICSPSRYSLLTGRYAWRGVLKQGVLLAWDEPVIEEDRLTLPEMLRRKGYETACIGKWHLGFHWPWKGGQKPPLSQIGRKVSKATCDMFDWSKPITGGPWAAGFDYYFGDDVPNVPPFAFVENGRLTCEPVDIDCDSLMSIGHSGFIHGSGPGEKGWSFEKVMPAITQHAVDYVRRHSGRRGPYFLLFSTTSPHTPIVPLESFQGKSEAGYYGDYVIQTDNAIGQVVQALKDAGSFGDTLLIVTSDNGPERIHRELIRTHQHSPAAHLRGMKWDAWEGGHRVPFIASWPKGGLDGGRRIVPLFSLTDIFATVAGIVDQPLSGTMAEDSLNILPSLRENKPIRTEAVYHAGSGALGLRDKNWVYLRQGGKEEPDWYKEQFRIKPVDSPALLFDLSTDEGEKVNLYHQHTKRALAMEARLQEIENSEFSR